MLLRLAALLTLVISLAACQTTKAQQGAIIGGGVGGVVGNSVGKGDGNTAAIIGGAIIGTVLGELLATQNHPTHTVVTSCSNYPSKGEQAACEQGAAERDRQIQQQRENKAYSCGRFGNC